MTKKSAIAKLTIIIIFTLIGAFLSLVCFNIPFTNSKWNSFVGGLNFGNDVSSGVLADYDLQLNNDSKSLEDVSFVARKNIYSTLNKYYTEPSVAMVGNDGLQIQIGASLDSSDENRVELALSQIGGESLFKVYDEDENQVLTVKNIKSLSYQKLAGTQTLVIEFDKQGKKILEEMSQSCLESYSNLIIQFSDADGDKMESVPTEAITDGKLYISGGINKSAIVARIINIECEQAGITLNYNETKIVSENLGNNFGTIFLIAIATILVFTLILMCLKYRLFGLISICSTLLFTAIYTLFLNILPAMQITSGSFIGIAVSYMIMNFSTIYFCEQILIENKQGKKVKTAIDFAFKKTLKVLLDLTFVILIPAFVLIFVGSSSVNNFAVALCVGLLINLFITLIVTAQCFKSCGKLCAKKPQSLNLKKEVLKDENI